MTQSGDKPTAAPPYRRYKWKCAPHRIRSCRWGQRRPESPQTTPPSRPGCTLYPVPSLAAARGAGWRHTTPTSTCPPHGPPPVDHPSCLIRPPALRSPPSLRNGRCPDRACSPSAHPHCLTTHGSYPQRLQALAGTPVSDGGTSDGGTSDGGTSDGGTSDGSTNDAGASDAGASNAGASDAGPHVGLGSRRYRCASNHL